MDIKKEQSNKNEKSPKKNELNDIFENILEVDSEDNSKLKRRNSFSGKNIFIKKIKQKQLENKKKLINKNQKEKKQEKEKEKERISSLENEKNSLSSFKLEINQENKNDKKISKISELSKLKRDKSYKTLKNNYNKLAFNDKKSDISSSSFNRNFILKTDFFKKDNSYDNNEEKEKIKKNIFLLLTNKSEAQNENPFLKFYIGNNIEEKIDFKQSDENKKNIFSHTYLDNEEEDELNKERYKIKNIVNTFDNKSINEKYLKKNIIFQDKKIEDEIIQEKKLEEKVYKILKCDNCNCDDKEKEENIENTNNKNNSINNNINLSYLNDINNNPKRLIQYSIQNNYINNNFNIQNQQRIPNLNQGYYYSYTQTYPYFNNSINPNISQYYNQNYFNPNMNINNNSFRQYNYNYNNQSFNPIYQMNNINDNQNFLNFNNLNNIDDVTLAKMSLSLLKSQIGCQILETRVKINNKFANDLLFYELKNKLSQICCDLFGSYLMQSLLDKLNLENLDIFLSSIQENIFNISLTENGSRVMQKLIEKLQQNPLLINKFIYYLNQKDIGILMKSAYGNHLIQKFLEKIKDIQLTNFIYIYLYKNFMDIVKSKYGVCVIQRGLSEGNKNQRENFFNLILINLNEIIKDCYGNFLIQFIFFKFDKNKFNEILPIIEKINENIIDYCTNQYSSSVIEKCFEKNEIKIGEIIINCLLQFHEKEIVFILQNQFGKYIIKKSFIFRNKFYRHKIMLAIINNIEKMNLNPEKEKILESLKQEYPDFSILLSQIGL